jgi:hypothetical protein
MLFLWVFGDNIEDRLGHVVFFLFYLLAGIVAAFIQGAIDPDSVVPVLGASGAVAGVLGAYLLWFPGATIRVVIPFFVLIFIPLPIPAWIMIGGWIRDNRRRGRAGAGRGLVRAHRRVPVRDAGCRDCWTAAVSQRGLTQSARRTQRTRAWVA